VEWSNEKVTRSSDTFEMFWKILSTWSGKFYMRQFQKMNRKMSEVDFLELSRKEELEILNCLREIENTSSTNSNLIHQDSSSIDDLTLSQIAENIENEHYLLTDMNDLTVSQTIGQYMGDLGTFDMEIDTLETHGDTGIENARFQSSVSDEDLKTLIENQENVNTKGNTKWAVNVFNKWREQRDINIPDGHNQYEFLASKIYSRGTKAGRR